ncbi:MAG: GP88 family protein [Cellulosilyticaceae bacterium]
MRYCNISFTENNGRCNPNDSFTYLLWNLPSKITCPYATEMCKEKCYASYPEKIYKYALSSRMNNLEESKLDTFEDKAIGAIEKFIHLKKNAEKFVIIRIHTSGDFYSQEYFDKWVDIANRFKDNKNIMFQAFTKSVRYLKKHDLKDVNIHFVYSVWNDTKQEEIEIAKSLGLPMYWAKPENEVIEAREQGVYICPKTTDGSCKECYKCNHKLIVSQYQ